MSYKLVLELPNDVYDPLADTARRTGATPEQLAVEWLAVAGGRHAARDPLEKFIGTIPGNTADWVDRHDNYLGRQLTETNDPTLGR